MLSPEKNDVNTAKLNIYETAEMNKKGPNPPPTVTKSLRDNSKDSLEMSEGIADMSARAALPATSGESKQTFSGKRHNKNRILLTTQITDLPRYFL